MQKKHAKRRNLPLSAPIWTGRLTAVLTSGKTMHLNLAPSSANLLGEFLAFVAGTALG
jgi:hypothetical protein